MNGLLHRLAARAAGTAALVRSDARLSYGGGTLAWPDTPTSHLAATRVALEPAVPATPTPIRRATQAGDIEQGPPPPKTAEQTPQDVPVDQELPDVASRMAHEPRDGAEPAIASRPERPLLEPTPPEQPLLEPKGAASVADAARILAASGESSTANRHSRMAHFARDADAALRVAPIADDPAPLLPPVADRSTGLAIAPARREAAAASLQPAAWTQAPVGNTDDAGEVHIHIGRIDVTAVREAPPPRRKPVATPAPMSLDTYLARRSRS